MTHAFKEWDIVAGTSLPVVIPTKPDIVTVFVSCCVLNGMLSSLAFLISGLVFGVAKRRPFRRAGLVVYGAAEAGAFAAVVGGARVFS